VHNSPRWHDYVKRSVSTLDDLEGAIADKNRYNLFVLHECLASIDIFFEAFPCMKWINLLRHPIDLVHSWYLRGWGYRFTTDPLSFFPMIKGEKSATPWFAWNRRDDFVKTSGIDSIIFSIASLMELGQKAFLNIEPSHKRQVVSICYEDLVENTSRILEVLSSFLEDSPSDGMQVILSREKCPRVLSEEKRKAKMEDIQQIANQESFKLLLHLVNEYESGNYYRIFQQ